MSGAASSEDVERACVALLRGADRLATTLSLVPDPAVGAVGVWSIAETAAHVSQSAPYFLRAAQGHGDLEDVADNARTTVRAVADEPERDLNRLARRIVAGESALAAYARGADGDPPVTPFRGIAIPLSGLLGVELGELIVHGFDIARAAGLPWRVPPDDAAVAAAGEVQLMPLLLDRERGAGLHLRCALHIRHGTPVVVVVEHGGLRIEPAGPAAVECRLSADPLAFLLLSFHRIGLLHAVLSGRLVAWGRRPWRVHRLQSVLTPV